MIRSFWVHWFLLFGVVATMGCPGGSNINPIGDVWVQVDVPKDLSNLKIPCVVDNDCPSALGGAGGCVLPQCVAEFCTNGPAADSTTCNDNDGCTENDQCSAGACIGTPRDCDDGNPCLDYFCVEGECGSTPNTLTCNDGNPCTTEDLCAEGACLGVERVCDDGEICTDNTCDPDASDEDACFFTANTVACDDENPCTETDICAEAECGGLERDCDDNNSCTANFCDPNIEDGCAFTVTDGDCDDSNTCTPSSACDHGACIPGAWSYSTTPCAQSNCGNNICDADESCLSCSYDCGLCCGNDNCDTDFGENCLLCPEDCDSCATCGDATCEAELGEDCDTCPADCGACGSETVCSPDLPITCGVAELSTVPPELPTENVDFGLTSVINSYNCADTEGIDFSGPERSFKYTPNCSGLITLKVHRTGGLGRLDVMVLDARDPCTGNSCIASGVMDADGADEGYATLRFKAHEGHPYNVVVDGEFGAFGDFKLSSSCVCDVPPEDCTDKVENDADGKEDCLDPQCVGEAQCGGTEFSCTNNIDDNYDGYTDCEDVICYPDGTDPSAPCFDKLCPTGGTLECGAAIVAGSLAIGTLEDVWTSYECAPGNYFGKEKVYRFIPDCTSTVTIDWDRIDPGPGTIDLIVFRGITSCDTLDGYAVECLTTASQGPGGSGSLTFTAYEGITYTLVFDGTNGTQGAFQIESVTCDCGVVTPESCGNLLDDDDDNLVDCDDPNCDGDLNCELEDCTNGLDDNQNFLIDCYDPVCATTGACLDSGDGCTLDLGVEAVAGDTLGHEIIGTTNGGTDQLVVHDNVCGPGSQSFGAGTSDRFHSIQVGADGRYRVSVEALGSSPLTPVPTVAVLDACPPAPGYWCLGATANPVGMLVDLDADYPASIAVDAGEVGGIGTDYRITISRAEKDCSDGIDDEGDGFVDCGDPDCIDDLEACPPQGNTCVDAIIVDQLPYVHYSTTEYGTSNSSVTAGQCTGLPFTAGQVSPDVFYKFTAPDTGSYVFSLRDNLVGSFDTILYLLDDCDGDCVFGDDENGSGESITRVLTEGASVYVVVDGFNPVVPESGTYQLTIQQKETDCANAQDDDKDELFDCDDTDCIGTDGCPIAGDTCNDAPVIDSSDLPALYLGDTTNATKDYSVPPGACPGELSARGAGSPDVSLSFVPDVSGFYIFQLVPEFTNFNSLLYAVTNCNDISANCIAADDNQSANSTNGGEALILGLKKQELINVIIDGWSGSSFVAGAFGLEVDFLGIAEVECNNFQDDDLDGAQDCNDPDCSGVGFCPVKGQTCNSAIDFSSNNTFVLGTTFQGINSFEVPGGVCPGLDETSGSVAPDTKIRFTAPESAIYRFSLDPAATDFDSVLYAFTSCDQDSTCLAGADSPGTGNDQMDVALSAGQVIFLVVDGTSTDVAHQGDFYLNIEKLQDFESACDDASDNDGDSLIDCDDSDCVNSPSCPVVGNSCETPFEITEVPVNLPGNTSQSNASVQVSEACAVLDEESGDVGKDVIYRLTAPKSGTYLASLPAGLSDFDSVLYVQDGCASSSSCLSSADIPGGAGESLVFSVAAGEQVYLVVDSLSSTESGNFVLTLFFLSAPEAECEDGADNDQDFLVDCDDPDCSEVEVCVE